MKLIKTLCYKNWRFFCEELISQTIPDAIRLENELDISAPLSEYEMLQHSKELAAKNLDYDTTLVLVIITVFCQVLSEKYFRKS